MNFNLSFALKQKSSGYGEVITNRPKIESLCFRPKRADHDDFAYLQIVLADIEISMTKEEALKMIRALEGVLK